MTDLISRADAIEAVCCACDDDGRVHYPKCGLKEYCLDIKALLALPSADAVSREDADMLVGLRNFKEYIRGYNSATADAVEVVRCEECKHFELDHFDMVNGIPIITAHEICTRWCDGAKTDKNGFCFMAERREP